MLTKFVGMPRPAIARWRFLPQSTQFGLILKLAFAETSASYLVVTPRHGTVQRKYKPLMDVVAMSLSPGFTTQAVERRKQIAGVLPRMNLGVKSDKRKGKKGSRK